MGCGGIEHTRDDERASCPAVVRGVAVDRGQSARAVATTMTVARRGVWTRRMRLGVPTRPRVARREGQLAREVRHAQRNASTRPRIITRGEGSGRSRARTCPACFNEAPHHHAGRARSPRSGSSRCTCFNEAPHHHAGRDTLSATHVGALLLLQRGPASSRGESGIGERRAQVQRAASTRPRIITRGESVGVARRRDRRGPASTRPRIITRGEDRQRVGGDGRLDASTRPRIITRGETIVINHFRIEQAELQRGPASSRGERRRAHHGRPDGRGRASTRPRIITRGEAPTRSARSSRARRFNEAPHHHAGRGGRRSRRSPRCCASFNEAPHHHAGRGGRATSPSCCSTPCFNEAPHHHAGRLSVGVRRASRRMVLQRGPASSRGESRQLRPVPA